MRDAAYTYFGFEKRVIIANHQEMTTAKKNSLGIVDMRTYSSKTMSFLKQKPPQNRAILFQV